MEFGQCFRLILIGVWVWHFMCWSHVAASSQHSQESPFQSCQSKSKNWSFTSIPSSVLPANVKFMISLSQFCTENDVDCIPKCLDGASPFVQIADCDVNTPTQSWFQLDRLLVNILEQKCLTANFTDHSVSLEICNPSNDFQKWFCGNVNLSATFTLKSNISSIYLTNNLNSSLFLTNTAITPWQVFKSETFQSGEPLGSPVCKKVHRFCGLPVPGLHSYIVSSRLDFSIIAYLSTTTLQQHLEYDIKSCYVSGDMLLVSCAKGHVRIAASDDTYKLMTCIGGGIWTNAKPLQCVKRSCGSPKRHPNTKIEGGGDYSYEDILRIKCVHPYVGISTAWVCGPDGEWIGEIPHCKHFCHFHLTNLTGQIISPQYPQPYQSLLNCEWRISVDPGLRIALWFRDFYIEAGSLLIGECRHDALYIQDIPLDATKGVERFCGSYHPEQWYSKANRVLVGFESDYGGRGKGFKIDYTTWNASKVEIPTKPSRDGIYPDEDDDSQVYFGSDQANFYFQAIYVTVVSIAVVFVIIIVATHFYQDIKTRLHVEPTEEDFADELERKRKLAQRRMTTVFDPMTVTPSVLINEALLLGASSSSSSSRSTLDEFKPPEEDEPQQLWTAGEIESTTDNTEAYNPPPHFPANENIPSIMTKSKRQSAPTLRFTSRQPQKSNKVENKTVRMA